MSYKFLSYKLTKTSAACIGAVRPEFKQTRHVTEGWAQNEWEITIPNHLGTHMDAPNHHYDNGIKIADLEMDRFVYEKPYIVDVPKGFSELITVEDLKPFAEEIAKCDLLMLRTGHSKYHDTDEYTYAAKGPGLSSQAAEYINKNFENVKGVFCDFIMLAAYTDIEDGNKAHKWLLGEWSDHYCTIIEDATCEGLSNDTLVRVFALPIRYGEVDSAQVSVLAEIRD
ncbi:MAG: cyclase family protein [Eubacteriales bacterium]|nr:cyclase family protein [Eubacteriales bacterium]